MPSVSLGNFVLTTILQSEQLSAVFDAYPLFRSNSKTLTVSDGIGLVFVNSGTSRLLKMALADDCIDFGWSV